MAFLKNGLDIYYEMTILYDRMLTTIFKPSIDNTNVQKCFAHILQNMDYNKYRDVLYSMERYPGISRKFVVFEYIHSPSDATVLQAEYTPGTRVPIHSLVQSPDFRTNIIRLFGDVNYYTRRKQDFSKPIDERLTNTRQLVVEFSPSAVSNDDYADMPPLISPDNSYVPRPVLSPEDNYSDMPSLDTTPSIQTPSYNYMYGNGLNRTIWSPLAYPYTYNHLTT